MAEAWRFADVAACCEVSSPAGCRIFRELYNVFPSILGHYLDVVFLGKAFHPQMLHLTQVKMSTWYDRDGNVYDKSYAPKRLHVCMLSVELKWHLNEQVE